MISDPRVVRELESLASAHGGLLQPEKVVEAAQSPASSLHPHFTWDDSAAACAHRLWQARQLIRIVVRHAGPDGDQRPMQVFVSLTSDRKLEGGGYRQLVAVLSSAEQRSQLLDDAMREMEHFRNKYKDLRELSDIFAAMDRSQSELNAA